MEHLKLEIKRKLGKEVHSGTLYFGDKIVVQFSISEKELDIIRLNGLLLECDSIESDVTSAYKGIIVKEL